MTNERIAIWLDAKYQCGAIEPRAAERTALHAVADIAAMAATVGTRPTPLLRREVGGLGEVVRARRVKDVGRYEIVMNRAGAAFEHHLDDPADTPIEQVRTLIVVSVR